MEALSHLFSRIAGLWGSPQVDLFASRTSHQLESYMTLKMDPEALAADAMVQNWSDFSLVYAFPPFCMIGRVLQKLRNHSCQMILIAPKWSMQPWHSSLLELAMDFPILLPAKRDLLMNPQGEFHPLSIQHKRFQLVAWRLSANSCDQKEFRKKLLNSYQIVGERALHMDMTGPGSALCAGVAKEGPIPFVAL